MTTHATRGAETMDMDALICSACGLSLGQALLLACLVDAGARTMPHPLQCAGGGEHNFRPVVLRERSCYAHAP